jgi:nitroimidazol reductase NimA-like FMN-containing flavoprotein (pyridoxamine 5'-phosphate oxidase superfamily)
MMRRSEFLVDDRGKIVEILDECKIMRVAMVDGDKPYIVPVNYGYELSDGVLTMYFHSAVVGRKIDIFNRNKNVCFELDCSFELVMGETACSTTCRYASIIGSGELEFLDSKEEKTNAFKIMMKHQTGRDYNEFPEEALAKTAVMIIRSTDFTGKVR